MSIDFDELKEKAKEKETMAKDKIAAAKENKKTASAMKALLDILPYFIVFIGVIIIVKALVISSLITSGSMEPTLMTGDRAIYFRWAYINSEPERGDIIDFHYGDDVYSKRVIGTPGDFVQFDSGYVYINGEKISEPYIDDDVETNCLSSFIVPDDSYFVLGDNREDSYDSRFWDDPYVKRDDIMGKLLFNIPMHKLKYLENFMF